jgi:hypothetical protein
MTIKTIEVISRMDEGYLDDQAEMYSAQNRMDAGVLAAGTGYFFKRQLEHVFTETLTANLPVPNFSRFFPIDTSVREGAKGYTQRIMEPVGEAIIISNFGDDLPRVNVVRREERRSIKMLGDAYGYSVQDIMAARFAGEPLDTSLGLAAREAIERKHNRLCFWGDEENGLWGILRHPYIPRFIFSEQLSSAASSADAIIAQINAMVNGVNSLTKTTAQVDTVVLPPDEYAYIHSARITDTNITIAEFILKNSPFLKRFEQSWECDADENDGQALCFAYRKDPMSVKYVAPITFRQLPVERRNLEFVINNIGSSGGFYTPRPLEMVIGELLRA